MSYETIDAPSCICGSKAKYTKDEVWDLLVKLRQDLIDEHDAQITNMSLLEWFNKNKKS